MFIGSRSRTEPVTVYLTDNTENGDVIFNTVPGQTLLEAGSDTNDAKEIELSTHKVCLFFNNVLIFILDAYREIQFILFLIFRKKFLKRF